MKAREVIARIEARGGRFVRQSGSHRRYAVDYLDGETSRTAHTTVQVHPGRDIPIGTLRAIERDLPVRSRKGMAPMSYTANVTREGNDWLAEVRDLPGAHAFARTLAALRRKLADAIILSADLPDGSPVEIDLVLDDPQLAGLQAAVDLSVERHRAAEVAASLTARTEEAARRLVGAGWSVRDVAGALDVTAGRVSQLTRERRPA